MLTRDKKTSTTLIHRCLLNVYYISVRSLVRLLPFYRTLLTRDIDNLSVCLSACLSVRPLRSGTR